MTIDSITQNNNYAATFDQYIVRTLEAIKVASQVEGDTLSVATRQRALRALDFALDSQTAQSLTRELLVALAPKMEKAGLRDEWIAQLERGIETASQANDTYMEGQLALQLGQLYQLLSQFDRATDYFRRSITLFSQKQCESEMAVALNRLAYVAVLQGNAQQSRDLAEQARYLISKDNQEMAYCLFILGMAAKVEEDWISAESYLTQSLELRRCSGTAREIALALMNLGVILRSSKQFERAQNCYHEAIALFQELDDSLYIATCRMNLGNIYLTQKLFEQAIECYQISEPVFRQFHHDLRLANVYNNIGLAYAGLSEWEKAETALRISASRYQSMGCAYEEIDATCEMISMYIQKDALAQALRLGNQAKQRLQQLPDNASKKRLATWLDFLMTSVNTQMFHHPPVPS